jgi:acid phosphatase type 7
VEILRRVRPSCPPLAALALLLAAWPAAPAEAAFPGHNGLIVHEGRASVTGTLYLHRGDGSPAGRVHGPRGVPATDPAFSPLGQRVAFASGGAIWTEQADGTGRRPVTVPAAASEPTWSPNGDALAFTQGAPGARHIVEIGADGNDLRPLTQGLVDDRSPAWSSRNRVAFVRRTPRSGDKIYLTDPRLPHARRVSHGKRDDQDPSWAPDGRRIAFVRGEPGRKDLWVIFRSGRGARKVTDLKAPMSSPAWSPGGRHIAFSMGSRGRRQIWTVHPDGTGLRPVTRPRGDAIAPDWQAIGQDPLIAAAGDVACSPGAPAFAAGLGTARRCHQLATSNLVLLRDYTAVLMLGDAQYDNGEYENFLASYAPTWGRVKSITHPVPGNHEYKTPGAAGYFDYFNGPGVPSGRAGERGAGYYSFDVGAWHIVALNSECSDLLNAAAAPSCAAGSPMEQWLRSDLAQNNSLCTLAFWHHPLLSSGAEGDSPEMAAIWQALYDANVDVILNGHAHAYERFAPQNPFGAADGVRGIREFVVGTGGKTHQGLLQVKPTSEVRNFDSYGILEMGLHRRRYDWRFVPDGPGGFRDKGETACH